MYIPKPIDTNNVVLPEQLMSLQEKIAENVHEIWAQGRIADGWTYGEKRDDELKHHPCLVPYSELSDAEKEYDRNTAMETLKLITALGYNIEAPSHNKEMKDNEEARKSDFTINENGVLLSYTGKEKDVVVPDNVTKIGDGAFLDCTSLTSITIPDSVTNIGYGAFSGCTSLTSITIPDSITSIGANAFLCCTSLTNITIPDSVTSIGSGAFAVCKSLTDVTIPKNLTNIGSSAFYDTAYYNDANNWENDVLYIGNHLIEAKYTLSGEYVIKDGTKYIDEDAFLSCTLTSITIPDSVTNIDNDAFFGCDNLSTITIPDSVINIGDGAFGKCDNLSTIVIPDGVTSIGRDAFSGCASLETVEFKGEVENLNQYLFRYSDVKQIIVHSESMADKLIKTGNVPEGCEIKVVSKKLEQSQENDELTPLEDINLAPNIESLRKECDEIMASDEKIDYGEPVEPNQNNSKDER